MFYVGTFNPKLDEKGRFFLPAKFREQLAEEVVIAPGQEHCLEVWSMDGFAKKATELQAHPRSDKRARDYIRFLSANSAQERMDKQGRVPLSSTLRDYAALQKEIVVTGALDHVEIWNPEAWERQQNLSADDFANLDGPIGRQE